MATSRILKISAEQTYPLRSVVLRNWDSNTPCPFDGDEDRSTRHFGCVVDDEIISIVSFYERKNENFGDKNMVQLRGMATHPDYAKQGHGKDLLIFTIEHFRKEDADLIWCNAREIAIPFYEKLNFKTIGETFEIQNIGTHIVMYYAYSPKNG